VPYLRTLLPSPLLKPFYLDEEHFLLKEGGFKGNAILAIVVAALAAVLAPFPLPQVLAHLQAEVLP